MGCRLSVAQKERGDHLLSSTTIPCLFGIGRNAADEEEVNTTLLTELSLAAASRRFTVPATTLGITTFGSGLKDTSEA